MSLLAFKALADKCNVPCQYVGDGIQMEPKKGLVIFCRERTLANGDTEWYVRVNGKDRYLAVRDTEALFFDMPEIVPELLYQRKS